MRTIIIIPAYQPSKPLLNLVNDLLDLDPEQKIIVIDDGSDLGSSRIFDAIRGKVLILKHAINMGKGQALKTAFNYVLLNFAECVAVVTADADGQHTASDIYRVRDAVRNSPTQLFLGVRKFEGKVPFRSRFGNALTRRVFAFFTGKNISDTQTGLRGIPKKFLPKLMKISSQGYEYELEMLIKASQNSVEIAEINIKTIYENNNESSHFNPVLDSLKIYFVFIRFSIVSILTAVIDFFCFLILYPIFESILVSILLGRIVSGAFNYFTEKKYVFKSNNNFLPEFTKYIFTVIFLMILSIEFIEFLNGEIGINVFASKVVADGLLFLVSFAIQRMYVFKYKDK